MHETTEAQVKEAAGTISKKVDGDFPTCMRHKKDNNDDNTRKNGDMEGKRRRKTQNTTMLMEMSHCVLRKTEEKSKNGSSSNRKEQQRKNESGSSTLNITKDGSKSKMASGSKDLCGDSTGKKIHESEKTKKQRRYVYRSTKNTRSMRERIEEVVCMLEGHRWDAILWSET